jgi:hypothetical protein
VDAVVVSAVGTAVSHGGSPEEVSRGKRVESAMADAVAQSQAEGITDPDAIRARILAARDKAAEL